MTPIAILLCIFSTTFSIDKHWNILPAAFGLSAVFFRIDLETIDPEVLRDLLDEVLPDDEVGGEAFAFCFDTGP